MCGVNWSNQGGNIVAAAVAVVLLAGCAREQDVEALKANAEQQKQQLAALKTAIDQQNQRIDALDAKISALTLESVAADLKSKQQGASTNSGSAPLTANQVAAVQKVIAQCVQEVRALASPGATPLSDVYVSFDAYYNPASGRVENNNQYVSQDAVYAFNKCMAKRGWPLR